MTIDQFLSPSHPEFGQARWVQFSNPVQGGFIICSLSLNWTDGQGYDRSISSTRGAGDVEAAFQRSLAELKEKAQKAEVEL